jgi:hypothetical protein
MSDTTGHIVHITDDGLMIACHEPMDADCRTEVGTCLVVAQADDEFIDFAEYYGGRGAHPPLVDGMPIDVEWDGECYEWTPAATSGSTA